MKLNLKNEEYLRKDSYLYDSKFDLFSFKKLVGKDQLQFIQQIWKALA